jgi:glycosyltransferase involved in cell wall biosynthesis
MRISLIITTYNWRKALEVVLVSALRQTRLPDEIIVADDGSADGTGEMVRNLARQAAVPIHHSWQADRGFRAAMSRNRAIAASTGDYLVMVDGDMVLEPHFIADHLAFARPGFFVQGSRVLLGEKTSRRLLAGETPSLHPLTPGIGNRKNALRLPWLARLLARRRDGLAGIRTCNFALFRDDALAVNGFDEDFEGWGREDSEFAARLLNKGMGRRNLRFAAVAWHIHHPVQSRASLPANDLLLARTIKEKRTWCTNGATKL